MRLAPQGVRRLRREKMRSLETRVPVMARSLLAIRQDSIFLQSAMTSAA